MLAPENPGNGAVTLSDALPAIYLMHASHTPTLNSVILPRSKYCSGVTASSGLSMISW